MIKKTMFSIFLLTFFVTVSCHKGNPNVENTPNKDSLELTTKVDNHLVNKLYGYYQIIDEDNKTGTIKLSTLDTTRYNYGVFIHFIDSIKYEMFRTAPCGNDCFFNIYGKYYLTHRDTITLILDSISQNKYCELEGITDYYGNINKYALEIIDNINKSEKIIDYNLSMDTISED